MEAVTPLLTLWHHAVWADARLFDALDAAAFPAEAWREYAHILGAEATWLHRLRREPSRIAVWPELTPDGARALRAELRDGYESLLAHLGSEELIAEVPYVNSAGQSFRSTMLDILLQVLLHGQYHRGKVNLLLRQQGATPAAADFIAFVRGAPAAVMPRAGG